MKVHSKIQCHDFSLQGLSFYYSMMNKKKLKLKNERKIIFSPKIANHVFKLVHETITNIL